MVKLQKVTILREAVVIYFKVLSAPAETEENHVKPQNG
jgi:hypothetical protein